MGSLNKRNNIGNKPEKLNNKNGKPENNEKV